MIKLVCNSCDQEIEQKDFLCEISLVENVAPKEAIGATQMQKTVFHICKLCFEKHLRKTLYASGDKV